MFIKTPFRVKKHEREGSSYLRTEPELSTICTRADYKEWMVMTSFNNAEDVRDGA
jgi:hypothetical protein